jgi:hypothetical protein
LNGKKVWVGEFVEKNPDKVRIKLSLRDLTRPVAPEAKAAAELYPGIDFTVLPKLLDPHKLVMKASNSLQQHVRDYRKHNPAYKGLVNCWRDLSINVSTDSIDRALCFMDALVKILGKRGHTVQVDHRTDVVIGTQRIEISLYEKTSRVINQGPGNSVSSQFVPNGKLCLKAETWKRKEWSDGRQSIEQQLPLILQRLEEEAEKLRLEQIAAEERRIEQARQEVLRKERHAREDRELKALWKLMSQAKRWEQMKMLRNYIQDMERLSRESDTLDQKKLEWIEWARQKADWFDPSIDREDNLLSHVDKHTLNMVREQHGYYNNSYDIGRHEQYDFWRTNWWNR